MGNIKGTMDDKWIELINMTYKDGDTLDADQFESTFFSGFKLYEATLQPKIEGTPGL